MAATEPKSILSVVATVKERLPDLVIKNGQMIFVRDKHRIALDFGDKRTFYNQIEEIATESERVSLEAENGIFYFVIDTATLWSYQDGWIPVTTPPREIVFIGTELPELGRSETLYAISNDGIYLWDSEGRKYTSVADKNFYASIADIDLLF